MVCFQSLVNHSLLTTSDSSPTSQSIASASQPSGPLLGIVPHEGAGSARKRVVRACEVCRRKKVKCNGQKPCSHCIGFEEECTYVDVKDRSAYSRRYVESLEKRLARLEEAYAALVERRLCGGACQRRESRDPMRRASDPGVGASLHRQPLQLLIPEACSVPNGDEGESSGEVSAGLSTLSAAHLIAEAITTLQARKQHTFPSSVTSEADQSKPLQQPVTPLGPSPEELFVPWTLPQPLAAFLSWLCNSSRAIGRSLFSLLQPPASQQEVEHLKTQARRQDAHLEGWYNGLPPAHRSFPPPKTNDPFTTLGSCAVFVCLRFQQLNLHLALQQLARRSTGITGPIEQADLARCTQLSAQTIQAFPTISQHLPPSPWLKLYAQSLAMSAAFLALTVVRRPSCNTGQLLTNVDDAVAALMHLEQSIKGTTKVSADLAKLVADIRSYLAQSEVMIKDNNKRKDRADRSEDADDRLTNKRIRAPTLPQGKTLSTNSLLFRSDTAPPKCSPPTPEFSAPIGSHAEVSHQSSNANIHQHATNLVIGFSPKDATPVQWQAGSNGHSCSVTNIVDDGWRRSDASFFNVPPQQNTEPGQAQRQQLQQRQQTPRPQEEQHRQTSSSFNVEMHGGQVLSFEAPDQDATMDRLLKEWMEQQPPQ